ncbi:MAG TPA: hypothetical protein VFS20_14095 [Longimicrobium sp.]|nr:hypothetical protein [Longimicrobium sp.]
MRVEETHQDVLQNIEAAIVDVHHAHHEMLDYDVDGALEALVAWYTAEQRGRTAREPVLHGLRQEVFDAVREICEWRLGRYASDLPPVGDGEVGVDVIVACLKKVRTSVQRWTREGGRNGYLTFIRQYVI